MSSSPDQPRRKAEREEKSKSYEAFWRAFRYLKPYRALVGVSILCALFVGIAFAGGLSTMMPIMRVLIEGDTLQDWVNRSITEDRLGVRLYDKPTPDGGVKIFKIRKPKTSIAYAAGLREEDEIRPPGEHLQPSAVLNFFSDPNLRSQTVISGDRTITVNFENLWPHQDISRRIVAYLPTDPVKAIAAVFGVLCAIAMVANVLKFFQEYFSDKSAILAVSDVRRRLYDHVLHVPLSQYGTRGTSDVTSRLVQDAQQMEIGFKAVLGPTIQEPIKASIAFCAAVYISWQLTVFMIVFVPLMGVIIQKFGKKMRRASRAALQNSSSMLGQIEGTLTGIRVVKGASAERFERRRYSRIMAQLVQQQLRMSRIDAFTQPTLETLTLLMSGAVVLVAARMVLKPPYPLDIPSFFTVMGCLVIIGDSLRKVSKVNNVLQKANAAAVRVFEVMDLPMERRRGPEANVAPTKVLTNLRPLQSEVRFEDVTFSYANASSPALVNVSLTVPKGRCVAVVGRNGSGKTTLLALLPRFYDPQSGRVTIDGVDLRNVSLRSLRRQISVVTQDSVIFPGTIAENIAYGHPLASRLANGDTRPSVQAIRERAIESAKRAFAHDFIMEKPGNYNMMLGEMGGALSGGQKQRLCIAHAIFRQAPILILDEATSQVDAESEHLIQQAIDGLLHESHDPVTGKPGASAPTMFVIAHRFSTIKSADVIVVMERGQIVGMGKHEELLETCETYQQLYERQLVIPRTVPTAAAS